MQTRAAKSSILSLVLPTRMPSCKAHKNAEALGKKAMYSVS